MRHGPERERREKRERPLLPTLAVVMPCACALIAGTAILPVWLIGCSTRARILFTLVMTVAALAACTPVWRLVLHAGRIGGDGPVRESGRRRHA